jgi:hypothetical protein
MDRPSSPDSSTLPGTGVLVLCAVILFAGYVAATLRAPGAQAVAVESAAAES